MRRLHLGSNRLTGPIPPELGNLTNLTHLTLQLNQLSGPIPPELGNLTNLTSLSLDHNSLNGPIPPQIGNLVNLTKLQLSDNRLSGPIPRELGNLVNLTWLQLFVNRFSGPIPRELGNLVNLPFLSLGGNRLTGPIPPEIGNLAGLTLLLLEDNNLEDPIPPELGNLTNLTELDLWGNRFAELPSGLFSNLERLESLNLGANRLQDLQPGAFNGLTRLNVLSLDDNPGSPFRFTLEPRRVDTDDLLAPGPATVGVALKQGALLNMTIPLSVHGGDASAGTVVLRAGTDISTEVTVTQGGDGQSATQVVAGPAPHLPNGIRGVELLVADPLILFGTVSNRTPIAESTMPLVRLRAGGEAATIDVSAYFRDPDGDDLTYTAASESPGIVSVTVSGNRVMVAPTGSGSATVTVTATDPDGLSAESSLAVSVRGATPGLFDIDLILIDEVSESIQAAFDDAVDYWSSILAGTELPDVPLNSGFELGCWDITTQQVLQSVDDLVIVASVREIDGPYGILASAGFCGIRDGEGGLPFMGAMQFDVDDLEQLEEGGDMEEVILHEMGHVLGIGTAWRSFGLLVNPSLPDNQGADTHFRGALAIEAFDSAGGTEYGGGEKVPVENRAGPGSGDVHWRESVLDHELMTPYQNSGVPDPLSTITIRSLADLGYVVNVSLAEFYRLPGTAADVVPQADKIEYGDDIMRGPIVVVNRDGQVVRVIPGGSN